MHENMNKLKKPEELLLANTHSIYAKEWRGQKWRETTEERRRQ